MDKPPKERQTRILRDPIIDEFQGSGLSCKGLGHIRQGTQKIIEREKILEWSIRAQVVVCGLNNDRSIRNDLPSRFLGPSGSSKYTKSWVQDYTTAPISSHGETEASAPLETALETREAQIHL